MKLLTMALKAVALFLGILVVITGGAAIISCLFLSNGQVAYLIDPQALFEFLWVTRAGLKATILFVTITTFLMIAENGALSKKWI